MHPGSASVTYLLGESLSSSGKLEESVVVLQQAIRLDPKALEPHLALAVTSDRLGRTAEAESEWRAALAIDPTSPAALRGLTKRLLADKDFRSVIALLHPSTGPVPLTAEQSLDLAFAYGQMGMLEDASATLRAALQVDPSSLPLAKALAGVLVMQARKQEAVDILESTIKQHPREMSVRLLYLRLLVLNDEAEKAQKLGNELLIALPHNWEVLYLNGVLEQRAGNYALARDHLQQAVALNPSDPESRHRLGSVLAKLKDLPGAKEQLGKAIALGSQDPDVRFELATVLRSLGETQEAQEQLNLYQREKQEKSDLTQAAAKAALADQKVAAGDFQPAISLYREALAVAPKEASLAYKLAMTFEKAGDLVNERVALEQALQIDPEMAEAHNQLGYLASRAGDAVSAEQHFRRAVSISPRFTRAWVNLAATLYLEEKWPEAKDAVAHALQLEPANPEARQLSKVLDGSVSEPQP